MGKSQKSEKTGGVKREFSAGGVVFKKDKKGNSWLVVNPKDTNRWQFPKGHIEKGESSESAATREVREEGGVVANPLQKIDIQKYFFVWEKERIFKTVTFFLMEYKIGDPTDHDKEVEESRFVSFEEAFEKLTYDKDKQTLLKAKEVLDSGTQASLI